jgi:archaellum component FlaC
MEKISQEIKKISREIEKISREIFSVRDMMTNNSYVLIL